MSAAPALSIIVPVHNGGAALHRCVDAIAPQLRSGDELLVVDDGSTEPMAFARNEPVRVLRLEQWSGVSAARNRGAGIARAPVLFFVDADVVLHPDAVDRARATMADSRVDAAIGSYDDSPQAGTLVSRFKNLAHHHFHQRAAGEISTFWGACGLVRRELFLALGGFDERRFKQPSIEDVEFGWRMTDRGARIVLDPGLQVTHLKRWTLGSLVRTDVLHRAAPWIRWSLGRGRLSAELNVSLEQRIAAALALVLLGAAVWAIEVPFARYVLVGALGASIAINRRLFGIFWRRGGLALCAAGFLLQQLYYVCAMVGAAIGLVLHCVSRRPVSEPTARQEC